MSSSSPGNLYSDHSPRMLHSASKSPPTTTTQRESSVDKRSLFKNFVSKYTTRIDDVLLDFDENRFDLDEYE